MESRKFWSSASPARRTVLAIVCVTGLIASGVLSFVLLGAGRHGFLALMTPLLHLPMPYLVGFVVLTSLWSSEAVAELWRFGLRAWCGWSDKRHFLAVAALWAILFPCQLWFFLGARLSLGPIGRALAN
jgi:hypothetical protein